VDLSLIIDKFSNYPWAIPIKTKQAEEIADNLIANVIKPHGRIMILHTDNGGEFISHVQKNRLQRFVNEFRHGSPHTPTTQGDIEEIITPKDG